MNYRDRVRHYYAANRAKNQQAKQALCLAKYEARYADGNKCPFDNKWGYEGTQERMLPNGWKLVFKIEYDSDYGPPEKEYDGCGETYRKCGYDYPTEKEKPWVLWSGHYEWLIYDRDASIKKALREGWDAEPYRTGTEREQALRAVKADFDHLYGYYNDYWHYIGIIVELYDENEHMVSEDSCWGFESSNMEYVISEARSWAANLLKSARKEAREAARQERIASRFHDAMECGV